LIVGDDVGGFGVGSDISLNARALLGYHFGMSIAAAGLGGLSDTYQDYDAGAGNNAFEWSILLHGPILGFTVRW
jgi:hypothetical protein